MVKMKSERPLLINGIPQTEFETTVHHSKELVSAGLAVVVSSGEDNAESVTDEAKTEGKSVEAPENKSRKAKQSEA